MNFPHKEEDLRNEASFNFRSVGSIFIFFPSFETGLKENGKGFFFAVREMKNPPHSGCQ